MGPVMCLVTDGLAAAHGPSTLAYVAAAARLGVHLIQVREPAFEARALAVFVRAVLAASAGTRARVLVNDRLDVALATGAHGVHLRETSFDAADARRAAPPGFLIGRSVHTVHDAARVSAAGAVDLLLFGTVFPTTSKPGVAGCGAEGLAAAVRAARVPVLAVGGVDETRLAAIAASGAAGFAAIRLWAQPVPDVVHAVARARAAF